LSYVAKTAGGADPAATQRYDKMAKAGATEQHAAKETRLEQIRRLFTQYNLAPEDVFKQNRGGREIVTIVRSGIDKIQARAGITLTYRIEALDLVAGIAALRCVATLGDRTVETFGTATPKNNTNPHTLEMAEKRARARAVLMLAGFYEQGVFGEGENLNEDGN
jgi:hypothetical protein